MKWTYAYYQWAWNGQGDSMDGGFSKMNELGQEGWELVNLAIYPYVTSTQARGGTKQWPSGETLALPFALTYSAGATIIATFKRPG